MNCVAGGFVAVCCLGLGTRFALAETPPAPIVWKFPGHTVKVYHGVTKLYTMVDSDVNGWTVPATALSMGFLVMDNGDKAVSNKYVKIAGITRTVHFKSDASHVVTVYDDGSMGVEGAGVCNVSIWLGSKIATLHFTVVTLPLRTGMSKDDVVKQLGLPDRRTEAFLDWPTEEEWLDGIRYSNERDDAQSYSVEHWIYNARPLAILSFEDGSLKDCLESSWDSFGMLNRAFS